MTEHDKFYQVGVKTRPTDGWTCNGICFRSHENAETSGHDLAMRWTAVYDWCVIERTPEYVMEHKLFINDSLVVKGPDHRVKL